MHANVMIVRSETQTLEGAVLHVWRARGYEGKWSACVCTFDLRYTQPVHTQPSPCGEVAGDPAL